MTAEIGILNKTAIALAADSAVTIQQEKGQKIYNSANKLFMLSKHCPVGVMLFGNATFMGLPWETIIKEYRNILGGKKYSILRDYANDFINYLTTNVSFFPEKEQAKYRDARIRANFVGIKKDVKHKIEEIIGKNGKATNEDIKRATSEVVNNHFEIWEQFSILKTLTMEDYKKFIQTYRDKILEIGKIIFEELPLGEKDFEKLSEISAGLFFKNRFLLGDSGIVFAGFGENDLFPVLVSFNFECIVENKLKYIEHISESISFDNAAAIIPFAQSEMVHTFIEGTDPSLEQFSNSFLSEIFNGYPNALLDNISIKDETQRSGVLKKLKEISKQIFDDYKKKVKSYRAENHIKPIVNIVAVLPKDELAAMAEALINLTSFKRKVTMDAETVGGPIDVAVISKGDGFVWIKRKHYFKPELNHHFFANYYREVEDEEKES